MTGNAPLIEMRNIVKVYPDGTVALRGVDFEVRPGEIHGLLGENGAGKTTLMKILSGMLQPTRGEIYLRGERVRFRSPHDALELGIGMVHQHFTLVDVFTSLENIVLGLEGHGIFSRINVENARDKIERLTGEVGLEVPLDVPVEKLPVGIQQRVEILKMLYRNVDVLILDEPTSVLSPLEVKELFKVLRNLRDQGKTIIFITHKLREVLEITDRITVLRQGKVVGKVETGTATPEHLARLMVGREVVLRVEKKPRTPGEPILKVENLWVRGDLKDYAVKGVSFEVKAGEIFGIAGVEGNGQTELVEAISGLRPVEKGRIFLGGVEVTGYDSARLYRMGLAHIPEDRRRRGLILEMTVSENSILGLHRTSRFMGPLLSLRWGSVKRHARELVEKFDIVTLSVDSPVKSLSGGNQQKLVVARELSKMPSLIVAAQPTRGLDVAATEYIRNLLVRLRDENKAILLVSADLDEVMQLSDRIAVMYEGRFMGVARPEELTEEKIGLMMGGVEVEG